MENAAHPPASWRRAQSGSEHAAQVHRLLLLRFGPKFTWVPIRLVLGPLSLCLCINWV